ncbi:MAG: tRNA uridine-5-carboxymethylaminomethyl(34) synthesis GTPase MnmE [Lachnospiraceae bacterium]|nr:tRNA uridine-5-carboxymethylaminomethyl(34) synthesis GTPase MnmE [Lachnospiraceae bacterium]
MEHDTIAAVATGLSASGISIIRVSGDAAFEIGDAVFRAASGKKVSEMESFKAAYGFIEADGKTIDEVLLLKMKAPHTYTREDVIEIDCHGGIVVTRAVLDAVIAAGARPAEPGEFTKRAFLNGRIDLTQAEAVSDIIAAKSSLALKNSLRQLRGDVKEKIAGLREIILSKTAFIEAALDDPEHFSLEGFPEELEADVDKMIEEISVLIKSNDNGRIISEGIATVILGRPNAGKSSLLNVILGEERAIVTDIAGTTRDTLEETVVLDGIVLRMTDTAGIRDTHDRIERIGVDRARAAAQEADLILYVVDATVGLTGEDIGILEMLRDKKCIILVNKTDVEDFDAASIREKIGDRSVPVIGISAAKNTGIDDLKKCITDMFFAGSLDINDEICITNVRQKNLLIEAKKSLEAVKASLSAGMPEDFYSIDLMAAYTSLGLITGDNVEDDLADRIFSEFCMGK